jgi:prepilin peptidase CpaA
MRLLLPGTVGSAALVVLLVASIASAISDLWKGKIYNAITYPTIAIGIALQLAGAGLPGLGSALAGLAVCGLPAFALFFVGGMGGGDFKLLAAVGAVAGWPAAAEILLLTFVFAGLVAMGQLAWHGRLFATFGRALRVLVGVVVRRWRPATPAPPMSVRFGVAICLGVLTTLWDLRTGALTDLF